MGYNRGGDEPSADRCRASDLVLYGGRDAPCLVFYAHSVDKLRPLGQIIADASEQEACQQNDQYGVEEF